MKKTFQFIYFSILLLLPLTIVAQSNDKKISGQLLDKETKEPIVFASIYLKGGTIGTTSNEEGYFTFHFPSFNHSNIIIISSIGYESIERNANDFISNQKILLNSKIGKLEEVVITSTKKKRLTAKQIVKKAYKQIEHNYPQEPYITEGFIRDLQNEDGTYVEYLECAAKFYNEGQNIPREPQVELVEVKSSHIANKHPWNEKWERKNSIIDLVEDDFIRFDYGPIKAKGNWKYELEDILLYNNKYVYKIVGVDKPFQKATLYIDTESFAFVKLELTRTKNNGKSWKRRLSNGQQVVHYNLIIEYQEFKGKMYLKYKKEEDTWEIYDIQNPKKLLFTKNPKKELFVNKVVIEDVENYPFEGNMKINKSLENQAKVYNAEFWSNYNAPEKTKTISKIEQYLKTKTK
ncbi:carboxypeptidase-like regulatory domain-containing protein [Aquimarina spongiae]|uniref:CarboxypepD_reg-like domain-containing protein n=1 Tax=Aquimarina spongiae TaxID=570521 RepID=A0A1M6DX59_9FLAO|nr:carboxypeptidase-like regulatory domain-containing protein [Aquimarina spongiae]SHI77733.1 CarboxypepD_reg-like domain-containing protein [Aquimarina spongiae]